MADEKKTVELALEPEPVVTEKKEVVTRESLREKGWSKAEMDAAEKRGMLGEQKDEKKQEEKEPEKKEQEKKEQEKKEPDQKAQPNFLDEMDKELTLAQEKVFLEMFPPGTKPRAFYFRAKNERLARQKAEQERDRMALELQLRKDRDAGPEQEQEVDEDGNVIDPEDKPLTMKQLKAMQKKEQEEMRQKQEELEERSVKVSDALKLQEEYAKSTLPDFEDTVRLAKNLVDNFDALVTDPLKRSKIAKMLRDLQVTAATADKFGVDDYTASMIAYELGQMHPEYGQKKPETNGDKKDPKANGSLTPEQMKRIQENTQRRASSASLPGSQGGRRTISVDDVTIKDVLGMSAEERRKFKSDHPERMAKLMRG